MPDKDLPEDVLKKLAEILEDNEIDKHMSLEIQEIVAKKLKEIYKDLLISFEFHLGQLVIWKDGLKNKRRPQVNEPAIVVEIMKEPIFDNEENGGSPYFREPLDMVIGVLDGEIENMSLLHVDKRRFKPFEEK